MLLHYWRNNHRIGWMKNCSFCPLRRMSRRNRTRCRLRVTSNCCFFWDFRVVGARFLLFMFAASELSLLGRMVISSCAHQVKVCERLLGFCMYACLHICRVCSESSGRSAILSLSFTVHSGVRRRPALPRRYV